MSERDSLLSLFGEVPPAALRLASSAFVLCSAVVLYRLFFSPLSKFPGPWLAAATGWYEFYYEFMHQGGGQFAFHIDDLHQTYGPVIRINPWELHINDPRYFDLIYSYKLHHDKLQHLKYLSTAPTSLVSTPEHHLHHGRRTALNSYFSKSRARDFCPIAGKMLDRLCEHLQQEYVGTSRVLNLEDLWTSFVADATCQYTLNMNFNWLQNPGFLCPLAETIDLVVELAPWMVAFPLVGWLATNIPDWMAHRLIRGVDGAIQFKAALVAEIVRLKSDEATSSTSSGHRNMLQELVCSSLGPPEKTVERLTDEALGTIGAGIHNTKTAFVLCSFHLLDNPHILERLRSELSTVMPDSPGRVPSMADLEKLPYLDACITEAVRLAYGSPARLPRISHTPLQFGDVVVPPGIPVSMQSISLHHDEAIFPDSRAFVPERWLETPHPSTLRKSMVSFGRGTRGCIGMHLAYAELMLGVAVIYWRVRMELYETDRTDVEITRAHFAGRPKKNSRRLRAKIKWVDL